MRCYDPRVPTRGSFARARLATVVLVCGCGDEVVGHFALAGTGSSGGDTSSSDGSSDAGDGSSGGTTGLVPPGCLSDDFEDGVIDAALWNTWFEEDATLVEAGGLLKLQPPSFGVWDTGVIGSYQASFPFVDGRVRVRVPDPPAASRPVVLFMRVLDDTGALLSIRMSEATIRIDTSIGEVEQYAEEFPTDPYPAWMAIRAEGDQVHYEVSDDGVTFTSLTTRDKLSEFASASVLLMAQTYGEDTDRSAVTVDDFEVCVQ